MIHSCNFAPFEACTIHRIELDREQRHLAVTHRIANKNSYPEAFPQTSPSANSYNLVAVLEKGESIWFSLSKTSCSFHLYLNLNVALPKS